FPERPTRHVRVGRGSAAVTLPGPFSVSKIASTEDSHPGNDAPHPRAGQTRSEIINGCTFSNLRQCRIRQYDVGQTANIDALGNRRPPGCFYFARLRPDNGCTYYLTSCRCDDFYVAA